MNFTALEKKKYDEFYDLHRDTTKATQHYFRWKCENDLYFLGSVIFGLRDVRDRKTKRKRLDPRVHKEMSSLLQTEDDALLLYPRGTLKTEWVKNKAVQNLLINPSARQALWSRTANLVRKELKSIKAKFRNPQLRELYPDVIPDNPKKYAKDTADELTLIKLEEMEEWDSGQSQIEVWGIDATVTGHHYDYHFYDDVIDKDSVTTPEQIEKVESWWQHVQAIREMSATEKMIGTRYHHADIYGTIIREEWFPKVVTRKAIVAGKSYYAFYTMPYLRKLKKRMGNWTFSCNVGWAPIWMADGTFKNLEDICVGDEVIGFELSKGKGKNKLVKTKVLAVNSRKAETIKVTMESGKIIYCTPDHNWWSGRSVSCNRKIYNYIKKPEKAHIKNSKGISHLRSIINTCVREDKADWRYLAGIFDGEGSASKGNFSISQSHILNPEVYNEIIRILKKLKIKYEIWTDERKSSASHISINGGRQPRINLINYGRPAKSRAIMDGIFYRPHQITKLKDKIVSVEPAGRKTVYSMQTASGNYVAWGYASKNCQMMNQPTPDEDKLFMSPYPVWHKLPEDPLWYMAIDPSLGKRYSNLAGIAIGCIDRDKHDKVYYQECYGVKLKPHALADEIVRKIIKYRPRRVGIEYGLQESLQYLIDIKLTAWEDENSTRIRPEFFPISTGKTKKAYKIGRTIAAFTRDGRAEFRAGMKDLFHQMDFYNPMSDKNDDDILDAAGMLIQTIEYFAKHFFEKKNELPKVKGYTLLDLMKVEKKVGWEAAFST